MNKQEELSEVILNEFQKARGKLVFYCYEKQLIPNIVNSLLIKYFSNKKNELAKVFIATDCYDTRAEIVRPLRDNNMYGKDTHYNIKALSMDYVTKQYIYQYDLTIIVGINDDYDIIEHLTKWSKFTMCILTENVMNNGFINNVRNILIGIDFTKYINSAVAEITNLPVEEYRIGVAMSADDRKKYDEDSKDIIATINIFGTLEKIEQARNGIPSSNTSSEQVLFEIANTNGWHEQLDVTIPFMRDIDANFNPVILKEKVKNFYNITRHRREIVVDNSAKLYKIVELCKKHKDDKVLIVSKNDDYCKRISDFLAQYDIKCGNYHDALEEIDDIDDEGNTILYKTGVRAGLPKRLGARAQSTRNAFYFRCRADENFRAINVLSAKLSANTSLEIACNVVIFTSSMYGNIEELIYRFKRSIFSGTPFIIYRLFINDTIEFDTFAKEAIKANVKVIEENILVNKS